MRRCRGVLSVRREHHSSEAYAARVITGVHNLLYANDAEAARAYFRDVVGWPNVDARGGWLIFKSGPSELAVHPTAGSNGGDEWSVAQHHEVTFVCDDVEATVRELRARGAEFAGGVKDQGFGLTVTMKVPGAGDIMLYEPKHPTAYDLPD
jgi:predicted enzyme related to lactoylglutathione lyase